MPQPHRKRGRPAGGSGPETLAAIREEGTRLLYEKGYDGMSLRDLAKQVGIQVSSLYNHSESKQQFLFELLNEYMQRMLSGLDEALAGLETPEAKLKGYVSYHIRYHTSKRVEASICLSELRRLEGSNRDAIVALRDAYEARLETIIREGQSSGAFSSADPRLVTFALLGMATSVLTWFHADGRLDTDAVVATYSSLALRSVSARH